MKIGIKIGTCRNDGPIPARAQIELYCIDTGETIDGVTGAELSYDVRDAITATVRLFPSEIRGTDEVLYRKTPPLASEETT